MSVFQAPANDGTSSGREAFSRWRFASTCVENAILGLAECEAKLSFLLSAALRATWVHSVGAAKCTR